MITCWIAIGIDAEITVVAGIINMSMYKRRKARREIFLQLDNFKALHHDLYINKGKIWSHSDDIHDLEHVLEIVRASWCYVKDMEGNVLNREPSGPCWAIGICGGRGSLLALEPQFQEPRNALKRTPKTPPCLSHPGGRLILSSPGRAGFVQVKLRTLKSMLTRNFLSDSGSG